MNRADCPYLGPPSFFDWVHRAITPWFFVWCFRTRHGQVRRGGRLELVGIDAVDSTGSSAVFSEGQVTVTNCSFTRCITGTNNVMRSLEASITSGGAALRALGGAIQAVGVEAALLSTGSSFVACSAQGGKYSNYGGAVYAFAMTRIDNSRFEANHVEGGTESSGGSALYIEARRLDIATSAFISNKARAHFQAYGGAVRLRDCTASMSLIMDRLPNFCNVAPSDCGVQLRAVTFVGNVASGGPGTSRIKGGAIYMTTELLCVNLTDSSFVANSAEDSVGNTEGGAVQVYDKAVLKIARTTFVGNTAKGASDQVRCPHPPQTRTHGHRHNQSITRSNSLCPSAKLMLQGRSH